MNSTSKRLSTGCDRDVGLYSVSTRPLVSVQPSLVVSVHVYERLEVFRLLIDSKTIAHTISVRTKKLVFVCGDGTTQHLTKFLG